MDFPDVWELKEKQRTVRFDTFTSNDGVAIKIASKLPVVKMVSKDLKCCLIFNNSRCLLTVLGLNTSTANRHNCPGKCHQRF